MRLGCVKPKAHLVYRLSSALPSGALRLTQDRLIYAGLQYTSLSTPPSMRGRTRTKCNGISLWKIPSGRLGGYDKCSRRRRNVCDVIIYRAPVSARACSQQGWLKPPPEPGFVYSRHHRIRLPGRAWETWPGALTTGVLFRHSGFR